MWGIEIDQNYKKAFLWYKRRLIMDLLSLNFNLKKLILMAI